jgi:hypothetical protein
MSKQYKPKQNINDRAPYCQVCHHAGKSDYNKHGLKDNNGKTICPYLLSLQCNTCKAFGHTKKHCDKNNQSQSAKTGEDKFCGFCYKVNKNDPAYKTHYVRKIKDDPDSEITCPRLKTTRCNYCHELGHTVISCNKRKLHSAYDNRRKNAIEENCDDSDSEESESDDEYNNKICIKIAYAKGFMDNIVNPDIGEELFGCKIDKYFIRRFIEEHPERCSKKCENKQTTIADADTTPRKPTWASRFDSKPNICNAPIPLTRTLTRFGIETKPLPLPSQSAVVNQTQPQPETETIKTPKKVISWADDDSDDE